MTREEAKQEWAKVHPLDLDLDSVIDVIYDDFESRTCENCEYNYYDKEYAILMCTNEDNNQEYLHNSKMQITLDFCCNKWESR